MVRAAWFANAAAFGESASCRHNAMRMGHGGIRRECRMAVTGYMNLSGYRECQNDQENKPAPNARGHGARTVPPLECSEPVHGQPIWSQVYTCRKGL